MSHIFCPMSCTEKKVSGAVFHSECSESDRVPYIFVPQAAAESLSTPPSTVARGYGTRHQRLDADLHDPGAAVGRLVRRVPGAPAVLARHGAGLREDGLPSSRHQL